MAHGDFSLNPYELAPNVVRVLMQQGRVTLDSDVNAAHAAHVSMLRLLAQDLLGPHAGNGFQLASMANGSDVAIGNGHYWVEGVLAQNGDPVTFARTMTPRENREIIVVALEGATTYKKQPWMEPITDNKPVLDDDTSLLFYLDVWERHVSAAENDAIREVALGGPDTTSRAEIVWQVRALEVPESFPTGGAIPPALGWYHVLRQYLGSRARLRAATEKNQNTDPCTLPPESRFRGRENQLYRVEIHQGSDLGDLGETPTVGKPTFKWSRDNGSIVFPVRKVTGTLVELDSLGFDERTGIRVGDWAEVVDRRTVFQGEAQPLAKVLKVDRSSMTVTLSAAPARQGDEKQRILRRWNGDVREVTEGSGTTGWIDLEDGIRVQFSHAAGKDGRPYRAGDYWLIPARVVTGDIIWPQNGPDDPSAVPPHGVAHHYAPLALWDGSDLQDLRMLINPPVVAAP